MGVVGADLCIIWYLFKQKPSMVYSLLNHGFWENVKAVKVKGLLFILFFWLRSRETKFGG